MNSRKVCTFPVFLRGPLCLVLVVCATLVAREPAQLPGQEITEEQYMDHKFSSQKIDSMVPESSPSSSTWLDKAAETWAAPTLSVQMAEDPEQLKMGMGAVFVPRMAEKGLEPDLEIMDANGEIVARGEPGRKYSLLPGAYYFMFGSGSQSQQIVREIKVIEGKVVPIVPDWSGLLVEVVDESNIPIRGEYELARIDKFEPYGRHRSADPDLGEDEKPWILRPGTYKLFEVGESYNTLTNFITVRLLPGEFTRVLLVMNNVDDQTIIGGGDVISGEERRLFTNWVYTFDLGGSIDFNANNDRLDTSATVRDSANLSLAMLSRVRLKFDRDPIDWDTRIKVDEGINLTWKDASLTGASSQRDNILIQSIFTWRVLDWLGPYGRVEGESEIIPSYERQPATVDKHYFVILDDSLRITRIDSAHSSYRMQPALSPLKIEAGLGVNTDLVNVRFLETRLLTGFGFSQEWRWGESEISDSVFVPESIDPTYTPADALYEEIAANEKSHSDIRPLGDAVTRPEFGPEASLYAILRLGKIANVESELKIFAPVQRYSESDFRPDLDWRTTVSWRIFRAVTLDYQYEYKLNWPAETDLRRRDSRHRVLIRFSYSSR